MITDHDQNGGYVNPPREKRQFRDPYADWWDKQGRRNFGEPVCLPPYPLYWCSALLKHPHIQLHEDDDILGRFSPEEYTWTTPGKGLVMIGTFVLTFSAFCGVVYQFYPDKPAIPRKFPHGGLAEALGGPGSLPALPDYDE